MRKPVALEHEEQAVFFEGVAWTYKSQSDFLPKLLFATFNGEIWRSYGKVAKAGLVKGVSDILYLQARGGYTFWACELKRSDRHGEKDGGVTPDELEWMESARRAGACVCVAYGADEAAQLFGSYMELDVNFL